MLCLTDFRVFCRDSVYRTVVLAQLQTRAYVVRFSGVAMGSECLRDVGRGLCHVFRITGISLIDASRCLQQPLRPFAREVFHRFAATELFHFGKGGERKLVVTIAEVISAGIGETVMLGWAAAHGLTRR